MHMIIGKINNIEKTLTQLKQLQNKYMVQLFDPEKVPSNRFIEFMYCIAKRRFKLKINKSNNISTELLLLAAGTPHVSKAIENVGVKDKRNVLLVTDYEEVEEIMRKLKFQPSKKFIKESKTENGYTDEEIRIEKTAINMID